jgi:hypothetical protein
VVMGLFCGGCLGGQMVAIFGVLGSFGELRGCTTRGDRELEDCSSEG